MGGTSYATFTSAGGGGGGGGGTAPRADALPLTMGSKSISVTFGTAFVGSAPIVVGTVFSTNASADIIGLQGIVVTLTGFTAQLSAAPTDGTYSLNWIASAIND